MHRMRQTTRGPREAVVGEPPPSLSCLTNMNPYPEPAESPDYLAIWPGCKHQGFYHYMRNKVAKLHMQYIKVKSITGFCNIKVSQVYTVPESCEQL